MDYCNYINFERKNVDYNIIQYGYRKCEPGFGEKLFVWPTYIIHYVYSGKGYLNADGHRFDVYEKQAFVIFPGQIANYFADEKEPFEYRWIQFYGNNANDLMLSAGCSPQNPIIDDASGLIGEAIKEIVDNGDMSQAMLMARFWMLADKISLGKEPKLSQAEKYAQQAKYFIQENIGAKTTVDDICKKLMISRNYLINIFNEHIGMSPKKYILKQHMDMAEDLLKRTELSVSEIAYIVGYDKPSDFTKAFIRYQGISPSSYRDQALAQTPSPQIP